MRSLVPIISFAVLTLSATALSRPSISGVSTKPAIAPLTTTCNPNGPSSKGTFAEQKLCDHAKRRLDRQKKQMEAQGSVGQCFTLKVYAPKDQKRSHPQGAIEKPYVPQVFALRSTCSHGGQLEELPLSGPAKLKK